MFCGVKGFALFGVQILPPTSEKKQQPLTINIREAAQEVLPRSESSEFFLCFENVLWNEGFYGGRSVNPATNLLIRSNPTAGGHPQTQLGTRYGWPLAHKELLRPLTGFVFHPAGCPYHTPSSPENLVGETVSTPTTRPCNRLVQFYMEPVASHRSNLA